MFCTPASKKNTKVHLSCELQMRARKNSLPIAFTIAIITLMVAVSEIIPEREVIFPEIAAIAVGALLAPHFTWQTDKKRILIFIMICAAFGMLIVQLLPVPLWLQLITAYALSQLILSFSGTSFAPMVSAIVLPVMLQTRTPLYLVSAFVFTSGILLLRLLLEHISFEGAPVRSRDTSTVVTPPSSGSDWIVIAKKILIAALAITAAVAAGYPFITAPPILVAFTEFANPSSGARKHPVKAVILISLCAAVGAGVRLAFTGVSGLPLAVSAAIATTVAIILIYRFRMFLPPAGAMTILAMLVPEEQLAAYPFCAAGGITLFMICAKMFFTTEGIP